MKFRIYCFLIALNFLILFNAEAQLITPDKRHYAGINGGLALPSGSYKTAADLNSAPASIGYGLNAEGAFYFLPYLGLAGTAGYFQNTLNRDQLLGANSKQITLDDTHWTNIYLMAGPVFSLPMPKVTLDFRALIGWMNITKPVVDYRNQYNTGLAFSEIKTDALSYNFGLALRYTLAKHWAVKLNVDYHIADASIVDKGYYYFSGRPFQLSESFSQELRIRTFNLGLGVVYCW